MSAYNDITIRIDGHGVYQTSAFGFDRLIANYLPASVNELRKIIAARVDGNEPDFSDLSTVTECLMVLGEYDGRNTN